MPEEDGYNVVSSPLGLRYRLFSGPHNVEGVLMNLCIPLICKECGSLYARYQTKGALKVYCSKQCRADAKRKRNIANRQARSEAEASRGETRVITKVEWQENFK
jgi:hypothetical protein